MSGAAVVVPLKAFTLGKARLESALDDAARERLARQLADGVLLASSPLPVVVACDDERVAAWASARGAAVAWTAGVGLSGAVALGVDAARELGATQAIVAHADLARPGALPRAAWFPGVTVVPDRRDDGTNVLCVPTVDRFGAPLSFGFAYGVGSAAAHVAAARALGLAVRVWRDPDLGWDIDVPDDLHAFDDLPAIDDLHAIDDDPQGDDETRTR